jgi:hypothetical protein
VDSAASGVQMGPLRARTIPGQARRTFNSPGREWVDPAASGVRRGAHQLAKFLVKQGADAKALDQYGQTPLHRASLRGHIKLAQFLV